MPKKPKSKKTYSGPYGIKSTGELTSPVSNRVEMFITETRKPKKVKMKAMEMTYGGERKGKPITKYMKKMKSK